MDGSCICIWLSTAPPPRRPRLLLPSQQANLMAYFCQLGFKVTQDGCTDPAVSFSQPGKPSLTSSEPAVPSSLEMEIILPSLGYRNFIHLYLFYSLLIFRHYNLSNPRLNVTKISCPRMCHSFLCEICSAEPIKSVNTASRLLHFGNTQTKRNQRTTALCLSLLSEWVSGS